MTAGPGDRRPRWAGSPAVALFAGAFGLATVVSGGRVVFGPDSARAAAGRYVPFVLWFNFLAGFAYVAAAVGIARSRRWSAPLSAAIAVATAFVLLAFGGYLLAGGAFEPRTAAAMVLRTGAWATIAWWARRRPGRGPDPVG